MASEDVVQALRVAARSLPREALEELRSAMARLAEGPGLIARLAEAMGTALGGVGLVFAGRLGMLARLGSVQGAMRAPAVQRQIGKVARAALVRAFEVAVVGLHTDLRSDDQGAARARGASTRARLLVAASGAAGGAAGLVGFAPDAAVTTLAIMRRIARIAVEEGEDLAREDARRACLEVFALRFGGPGTGSDGASSSYFSTRLLLQGGPLLRLLAEVAGRYGIQLGQKLAAQAVPVAGALCGAAINAAFMAEYEGLARAHFTIRRLERVFGEAAVRDAATRESVEL